MSIRIEKVTAEHYRIPLGIGQSAPRLSWRFCSDGDLKDWTQTSYEIQVTRTDPATRRARDTQSYAVLSPVSILVPWPSDPLGSREGATVQVRAHGSGGVSTDWAEVYVEAGLLNRSDWVARAITSRIQENSVPRRPFRLRRAFNLAGPNERARLYITAYGIYEVYINGRRVGDQVLAPGWQSYDYHLNYQVFDIASYLRPGPNVIAAWVGEGWYAGRLGYGGGRRNIYGERPALVAQLEVDGEVLVRTGDEGWVWKFGSIVQGEIYDGEEWDAVAAAEEQDSGWKGSDSASTRTREEWLEEGWQAAEVLEEVTAEMVSSQAPPVREVETFGIKDIITTPSGKTVVDFGQNFAGYVRILREPPAGTSEIVLSHAEVLEHGELGTRPLRYCRSIDRIRLGEGARVSGWTPKFTFHGFRYVQVDGWSDLAIGDLQGVAIHSEMERTGHFECSHALINRLHRNVVYSTLSNTVSIPTDCPQRDERLGWTGDIQVFGPTINFLFDASGFLSGWLKDLYADQKNLGGIVPLVVPDILARQKNLPQAIWGDVAVLTPLDLYTSFADRQILEAQYPSMVLWLERGVKRDSKTGLWAKDLPQLADWLSPKAPPAMPALAPTDNHLVADAYLIHVTRTAANICRILGKADEAVKYEQQASSLLEAFYQGYITPAGRIVSDTQTALALMIQFDLLSPSSSVRDVFTSRLAHLVAADLFRVSTGFAGTPIILPALAKAGYTQHAYRMLQEPTCPSFLSPVLLGATTIWERWDSMLQDGSINPGEMTSFNHYALGSVAHFMHSVIGGISPLEEGWRKVLVKPQPGGTVRSAKVSFVSGYGTVACEWAIKGGRFKVDVEVPPNTVARVELPGGLVEEVGSGRRRYDVPYEEDETWPPRVIQPFFCQPVKDEYLP